VAVGLASRAWQGRAEGWGIPLLTVTFTAFAWYPGDAIYNNYAEYVQIQGAEPLTAAWWEVLLFFLALGFLVPVINKKINGNLESRSQIFQMMRNRTIDTEQLQNQISLIVKVLILPWTLLMILALIRTDFDVIGIFFPYLGKKANPWARNRVGGGIDAIYAFAIYFQIMMTALFGVAAALSKRSSTFMQSLVIYLLSLPFFLFDRTRNTMLAVLLPGLMALVTLRIRGGMVVRLAILFGSFIALEGWMKFVIENRDKMSMTQALKTGGVKDPEVKARKHLGFNMFEELGYINYFIANGTYKVNCGERYFAELVNPIPRVLWPGKPLIGIDYAIARGMAYGEQDASSGGVACSVSTGMIGQGVVNFGPILGPIAAALIMACWVAVLARQDLMGHDIGHLLLYAIGLVLTFNMGRDITLLVIYPFVFGWLLLWWNNKRKAKG
jgi:hypothetical protein